MDLICAIPRVLTPAELSEVVLMKLKGVQEGFHEPPTWRGKGRKVHTSTSHVSVTPVCFVLKKLKC